MKTQTDPRLVPDSPIITHPSGAERLLAQFLSEVAPPMARLAEVHDALVADLAADPEARALPADERFKYLSAERRRPLLAERALLVDQVRRSFQDRSMDVERWQRDAVAETEAARLAPIDEPRDEKLAAVAEAVDLAGRDMIELHDEGLRMAAAGDVRGAQVRLTAARLTGQQRTPAQLLPLADAIESGLDATVPARIAAVEARRQAMLAGVAAQTAMIEAARTASMISTSDSRCLDARAELAVWLGAGS